MTLWPAIPLALILAAAAGGAQAATDTPEYTPAYAHCLAAPSGGSTAGMITCTANELKIQDARLNRAYQSALRRLPLPRQRAALQKAQRAWIAYRDADCASLQDADWGTLSRIEANSCVLDHTYRRADALQDYRSR